MIKKIKFFVRINGVPCHTLEDLQNNFYLQDVMSLYREGVLRRWLISNDEGTLAEKIKQLHIDEDNNTELAKSLIDILCPNFSKDSLNDALNYFYFEKKQSDLALQLQQNRDCTAESIAIHCHCFHSLLDEIEKNNTDFNFLCRAAIFLVDNYWQLFSLNFDHYSTLLNYSAPCIFFPLIAMGKFTSEELRDERVRTNLLTHIKDTIGNKTKLEDWYGGLCNASDEGIEAPSNFFLVEKTVDSWDDLVQDSQAKVMVFYMKTASARVRSVRTRDEFAVTNVNGVFPIFNGLDYKDVSSVPRMAFLILPDFIANRCCSYDSEVKEQVKETPKANEKSSSEDRLHDAFSSTLTLLQENAELIPKPLNNVLRAMKI